MKYQDYINLGFSRIDTEDGVEFRKTGYGGFFLEYKLNEKVSISVNYGELDCPRLYIERQDSDANGFILNLSSEQVYELISKPKKVKEHQLMA